MASGVLLAVALAAFLAAHVTLVAGLARARPRWRAVAALVVLPLAPWWGRGAGLRVATVVWCAALALYAAVAAILLAVH
jgi:hypothetical protein